MDTYGTIGLKEMSNLFAVDKTTSTLESRTPSLVTLVWKWKSPLLVKHPLPPNLQPSTSQSRTHATSNKCHGATLVVTGALLVVTKFASSNKCHATRSKDANARHERTGRSGRRFAFKSRAPFCRAAEDRAWRGPVRSVLCS